VGRSRWGLEGLHNEREPRGGLLLLEPEAALERAPGAEHDDGAPERVAEPPAVEVPHDVDGRAVDEDRLVAAEVPAQAARLHGALAVDADPELLLPRPGGAADADLVLRPALREQHPRGVHRAGGPAVAGVAVVPGGGDDAVCARNGEEPGLGDLALELGLDELGREVADGQHDLGVGDGDDVEPGDGFRGRGVVLGAGEVPEQRQRGVPGHGARAPAPAEEDGGGVRGGEGERGRAGGVVGPDEAEEKRRRGRGLRGRAVGDRDGEGGRGGGGARGEGGGDAGGGRGGAGDADGAVGDAGGEVPHGGGEEQAGRAHHCAACGVGGVEERERREGTGVVRVYEEGSQPWVVGAAHERCRVKASRGRW
jgi:hypothetical protein